MKRGSSVVSALASGGRGPGFQSQLAAMKIWCPSILPFVSFARNMNTVCRPSDRNVNWRPGKADTGCLCLQAKLIAYTLLTDHLITGKPFWFEPAEEKWFKSNHPS